MSVSREMAIREGMNTQTAIVQVGMVEDLTAADDDVESLHRDTSQALGMMRGFYRDNPVILSQLESLSAGAEYWGPILKETPALQSQWELLPGGDTNRVCLFTLAAFTAKRLATERLGFTPIEQSPLP